MKIAIIVIIIILALIVAAGFGVSSFIFGGRRQTLAEARAWQEERTDISWYDVIAKTSYTVKSFDGYELHVECLRNPVPTDDYVIISHGFTDNRMGALKYGQIYLDLGFNLIVYDLRGHGENEPSRVTYTLKERKDLRDLIKDTRRRYDNVRRLGLHGESLGAATSIAVLNYQPEVDFVVSDCAFSDIDKVLRDGLKANHIPGFVLSLVEFFAKLRFKVDVKDMRPIESLEGNRVPVLFIHGQADELIPAYHAEAMVAATAGYKDLRLMPGAGHAVSVFADPAAYKGFVKEFLDNVYTQ